MCWPVRVALRISAGRAPLGGTVAALGAPFGMGVRPMCGVGCLLGVASVWGTRP